MNPQETPVHVRLWHCDFWLMAVASLLLTMSVYMLLPTMPRWLMETAHFSPVETGLSMGVFALGLYLFGAQCSWLVQHYRRNVVCMWAMGGVALCVASLWYVNTMRAGMVELWMIVAGRFLLGALFGLAQMVLSSTLVIDTSESFQRTDANRSVSWFARFALASGPLAGLLAYRFYDFDGVALGATALAVLALLMVKTVSFPFRAPDEQLHVASLDRFFLPHASVLFLNLMLVTTTVGLLLSQSCEPLFYVLVAVGFVLTLVFRRLVFRQPEQKSEIMSGLVLLLVSLLILLAYPASLLSPVLAGIGVGIVGSRFLLFFIKLSRHCQRGTSQSTYFLGWETGLALGVGLGYACFYRQPQQMLITAIILATISLALYHFFTHSWFVRNKNR